MLDNMYWIFCFLKDKCDFLTLTAHLLEKNKQQKPKTLKFSEVLDCALAALKIKKVIAETNQPIENYSKGKAFSLAYS